MKEAASYQMDVVTDATQSLGQGIRKSIQTYRKGAGRFARSLSEFVDIEDFLKSVHKVAKPEDHESRTSNIIHTTIDWSKQPSSSQKQQSSKYSMVTDDESEDESGNIGNHDNSAKVGISPQRQSNDQSTYSYQTRQKCKHSSHRGLDAQINKSVDKVSIGHFK